MRRRIPWAEVAAMARRADGAWRLHPSLATSDLHLLQHARRRVRALRPTTDYRYEFARGEAGEDDLGNPLFSLYVRVRYYTPEEKGAIERGELDPRHVM